MRVIRTGRNRYLISWTSNEVAGSVSIYRSQNATSNFKKIAEVDSVRQFADTLSVQGTEKKTTNYQRWHYKISSSKGEVGPKTFRHPKDRYANRAAELAHRHLQRDVGVPSYLIERPTEGRRCSCWDDVLRKTTKSSCNDPLCDGSGFVKGYGTPIDILVSYSPQKESVEQMPNLKFSQGQVPMWTSNKYLVEEGDYILRDVDWQLYEIVDVRPTTKKTFIIRQPMIGRIVEKNDKRYKLFKKYKDV